MKVRVNLVVEVDPKKWAAINSRLLDDEGRHTAADVRKDVREYYLYLAQAASLTEETDAEVSLSDKGA